MPITACQAQTTGLVPITCMPGTDHWTGAYHGMPGTDHGTGADHGMPGTDHWTGAYHGMPGESARVAP